MKLREGRKESKRRRPYRREKREIKKEKKGKQQEIWRRTEKAIGIDLHEQPLLVRSRTTRKATGNVLGDRERNQIRKKKKERKREREEESTEIKRSSLTERRGRKKHKRLSSP